MRRVGSYKDSLSTMLITLFGVSFKGLQSHRGVLMLWLFFASHHWPHVLDLRENVLAPVCNYISNKVHLPQYFY